MKWSRDYELYNYQRGACGGAVDGFTKGIYEGNRLAAGPFTRQLGIAATGAGKTIIASALIYWSWMQRKRRVLMLAHTDELVRQAGEKIYKTTGEFASVEKASKRASLEAPVVVGSFQSFASGERIKRFPANHFGLVIADEAHLSMAKTFKKSLDYFNRGGADLLGITATPERSDMIKLMDYYENVAFDIKMLDLILDNKLAPLTVQTCPLEIDVKNIDLSSDDDNDELASAIAPYYEEIIDEWEEHAKDRPTVCFHPTCASSKAFTERLQKRGIRAAHIDGNTKNRKDILAKYARGDIHFLNCAQLLIAGWDEPRIECVINLRLTRHRTPYTQIIGRGTRLSPGTGKTDCLILDFLWQFDDMDIFRPIDLFAESKEIKRMAQRKANKGGAIDLVALSNEAQIEREMMLIERMKQFQGERGKKVDVREFAAAMHQSHLVDYSPRSAWEQQPITPAQAELFSKWGVDPESVDSRGMAAKVMNHRFKNQLATAKQVSALRARNAIFDIGTLTIEQASAMIAKN